MTEKDHKALSRLIMYDKIKRLYEVEHRSIRWIARQLDMNFRTVRKYLEMDQREFESYSDKIISRAHILELYKDFINLINSLHEKTSVIITTNKAPTEWVQTLNDEVLATAIIDRLLYRCEVIKLSGTSYRLENRKTIFTSESTVNGKQLRKAASKTIQTQQ